MTTTATKNHAFVCCYTKVDESFPCNGLKIGETELETILYEALSKQAQVILNLDSLPDAGPLDIQLAERDDYSRQIEGLQDKKRVLYEQFLLQEISVEEYRGRKAEIDRELTRLQQLYSVSARRLPKQG